MKNTAYFDNAATTFPKPEEVYRFMDQFYRTSGVNIGRGNYGPINQAALLQEETRNLLLKLFHCNGKNVIFEPSATIALNQVIRGIKWHDGDIVYISPFEHNSVLRPLYYLRDKFNLKIIELCVNKENITYDLEKIKYQFQENKPNVVIVSHASNVCGVIAPIADIFYLSKRYKAINIVDMSQTAGLIDTNLIDSFADFAIFAGHKTLYGPFGISGFVLLNDIELEPLIYGGTGLESANPFMPEQIPIRFEAGSQNILSIAGLNASLKWIFKIGIKNIFDKEQEYANRIKLILGKCNKLRIISSKGISTGITSFIINGYSSDSLAPFFDSNGIFCRTGLQCSPLAHKFLGTFPNGTIRLSCSYFNSETDFIVLEEVIDKLQEEL